MVQDKEKLQGCLIAVMNRSEVLMAVGMIMMLFCVALPCRFVGRYRRFGEIYCLHSNDTDNWKVLYRVRGSTARIRAVQYSTFVQYCVRRECFQFTPTPRLRMDYNLFYLCVSFN
jgi:hypothetical protein